MSTQSAQAESIDRDVSRRNFMGRSGLVAAGLMASSEVGHAYPADNDRKIRMAVVGGGFGSQFYWHEHPNCVVKAVTDLYSSRRELLQKTYQCPVAYDSLEEMLKKATDIDAVAVFSGAPDHARHMKMCMDRGLHVITAVPACLSLEDARMMKETKEKTGLTYMMAETSYYRQPTIYAREMFRKGRFGELYYSEVEYYHDRGDLQTCITDKRHRNFAPDGSRSWRWGFPPMFYPTHCTGLLVGVTGERLTEVSCLGWTGERSELADHPLVADNAYNNPFWNMSSLMRTDRGHMCRCNIFWLTAAHGERAQWFGDKATLYMPNLRMHDTVQKTRMGATETIEVPKYWQTDMLPPAMRHASGHDGSHTFLTAEFINALVEDREPTVNLYEALAMTAPGLVAMESARRGGEQLKVPSFDLA